MGYHHTFRRPCTPPRFLIAIINSSLADMAGSWGGFCVFEPADLDINAFGKFVIFCAGGACFPGSLGASGIFPAPRWLKVILIQ